MKIFIDTNIFLDLILQRDNYKEAIKIFNAVEKGLFEGFILDITPLNIYYVAKKQHSNIKEFLKTVNRVLEIVGATNKEFKKALEIGNSDLEDNLQYIVAKENRCDLIITNDKGFYCKDIEILSSVEFVDKYFRLNN